MPFKVSPKENTLSAIEWRSPWWLPCPMFDESVKTVEPGIVEHRTEGVDDWGIVWVLRDPFSDGFPVGHPINTLEDLDKYEPPSPSRSRILEPIFEGVRRVDRNTSLLALDHGWGIFERAWLLLGGMSKLFLWSRLYPDAVEELMDMVVEVKLEVLDIALKEVDFDIVLYGDDWGMEDRLLFSPEWWRRFLKPRHEKLYRAVKNAGAFCYLHSDGKVETLIPELIDIGVDILNIQRECNNWAKILRDFQGKATLWGGVSARTLDRGTAEQVISEVKECIELGRLGGVIMAPGHALKYKSENIETMRRAWEEKRKYRD
ncbi:MAG: uroporphyrinogen decarboxylase family protein [Candidatus Bathyarchaeia archaeon]